MLLSGSENCCLKLQHCCSLQLSSLVLDCRGAVGAVWQEQLPHAKVVAHRPVAVLRLPGVELAHQRDGLQGTLTVSAGGDTLAC